MMPEKARFLQKCMPELSDKDAIKIDKAIKKGIRRAAHNHQDINYESIVKKACSDSGKEIDDSIRKCIARAYEANNELLATQDRLFGVISYFVSVLLLAREICMMESGNNNYVLHALIFVLAFLTWELLLVQKAISSEKWRNTIIDLNDNLPGVTLVTMFVFYFIKTINGKQCTLIMALIVSFLYVVHLGLYRAKDYEVIDPEVEEEKE